MKILNLMTKMKSDKIGFINNHKMKKKSNLFYQQRRLGLDIDMIGAKEENLGSTRSQTLELRSPSNQVMEQAYMNMENWIQEACYMSSVTSGPD